MKDSEMFTFIKKFKDWKKIKTPLHELNYFIVISPEKAYLFFQESDGKKDWKDNLNFLPVPCKVYKKQENHLICHRGFVREYKSGNDEIMVDFIQEWANNGEKEVVISGWSNGAAMAALAAEDFYYRTGVRPYLVTFGAPKVCFDFITSKTIKKCCRGVREYCEKNDVVTKLPPFFWHINKIKVGKKKIFGVFDPWKYHTNYDKELQEIGK